MIDPVLLTQKLIRCQSVTPNHDGAFDILSKCLDEIGFEVNVFECTDTDGRCVTNMYAKYGDSSTSIGFVGHVDVVPAGDLTKWQSNPFAANIIDSKLIGRGASDMKAAIACFIAGAEKYIKTHTEFDGQIVLMITGDEEEGSPQGMRSLINWCLKNNKMPKYCIIGEPSCKDSIGEAYLCGRRGSLNATVFSQGEQGHVAHPYLAFNAIDPLISYLNTLLAQKWDDGDDVFEPTNLELTSINVDNYASNIIPGKAEASFNIRFNKRYTSDVLDKTLHDMASLISSRLTVSTVASGEPVLSNCHLLSSAIESAVEGVVGVKPKRSTVGGVSDGRFLIEYCPLIEFGMTYNTIHKENEFVLIGDIEKLTLIYNLFLSNFFNRYRQFEVENID